jgi:tetratricopeptide (TPR) repeat protein
LVGDCYYEHPNQKIRSSEIFQKVQDLLKENRLSEALQLAQQAVKENPDDALAIEAYGDAFAEMENWAKAEEQYERAIQLSSVDAPIYAKLGRVHMVKGNHQIAYGHFQSASRLEPSNPDYSGRAGAMLYLHGDSLKNTNLMSDGFSMMKQSWDAGSSDEVVKEMLCISYLEKVFQSWVPDPESDDPLPTEKHHMEDAWEMLNQAKSFSDGSNEAINKRIADTEELLNNLQKKKFIGPNYLIKAPVVVGLILPFIGGKVLGIIVLAMAGLYYYSQMAPGFMINKLVLAGVKDPLIIRRLNAISSQFEGISIFGSSFGDVLFKRFLISFLISAVMYFSAVLMLPFEIIRGFMVNHR